MLGSKPKTEVDHRVKIRKWAINKRFRHFCSFSEFYSLINFLVFEPQHLSIKIFREVWTASPPNLKTIGGLGQILEQKIGKAEQFPIGITPRSAPNGSYWGKLQGVCREYSGCLCNAVTSHCIKFKDAQSYPMTCLICGAVYTSCRPTGCVIYLTAYNWLKTLRCYPFVCLFRPKMDFKIKWNRSLKNEIMLKDKQEIEFRFFFVARHFGVHLPLLFRSVRS